MSARALAIVPAIDLRGGRCVRLERGDPDRQTTYDGDPVQRARDFERAGATRLHVVDLDGAFSSGENVAALQAICSAVDIPVQTGGGIRRPAEIEARFAAGADAVILGTMLVEDPPGARALAERYLGKIIAGIDARGSRVATRGWQEEGGTDRDELVRTVAGWGIERVVFTEIARDGMGSGYDIAALTKVAGAANIHVTASGGARTIEDLIALRDGTPPNVDAAIVGRALYERTIDLVQALAALR